MDRRPGRRVDRAAVPGHLPPEHVRKILKHRLRWTSQRLEKRANGRDEEAIRHCREKDLPDIVRNARRRGVQLVFLDEAGFMPAPTVRRSFAPIGKTPFLRRWGRHDQISAISCIKVSPVKRRLGLAVLPTPARRHQRDGGADGGVLARASPPVAGAAAGRVGPRQRARQDQGGA
jgi:hypothetical protein